MGGGRFFIVGAQILLWGGLVGVVIGGEFKC